MKLAASKVDFRSGCEVGVTVVFDVPADVTTEGVGVGEEGRVVGLAVRLVGTGTVGGDAEQDLVSFAWLQFCTNSLEQKVLLSFLQSSQKQVMLGMVTLTQEIQLLWLSQVSGGVVGVWFVVTGLGVTVGVSVTLGGEVMF